MSRDSQGVQKHFILPLTIPRFSFTLPREKTIWLFIFKLLFALSQYEFEQCDVKRFSLACAHFRNIGTPYHNYFDVFVLFFHSLLLSAIR